MSDCTAIYPAKPIECLLGEGHDGDHAGEDSAGFQFRWSKPNADMVPAARLDAANLEIARLREALTDANLAMRQWQESEDGSDEENESIWRAINAIKAALTPKEP